MVREPWVLALVLGDSRQTLDPSTSRPVTCRTESVLHICGNGVDEEVLAKRDGFVIGSRGACSATCPRAAAPVLGAGSPSCLASASCLRFDPRGVWSQPSKDLPFLRKLVVVDKLESGSPPEATGSSCLFPV